MSAVRVKFGDIVRKVNDKVDPSVDDIERFVAGEHMDTDEQKIFRFGNVGEGYLGPAFHMRFKPGHILYGSRRTYLRKVAMADFEGVCSNTTFVIAPSDDRLDASYLLNVMSTERFHQNSISLSKGSTNPYINFSDLAAYEFELPSIEEQQRIVELLSGVDAHAEALRNQLHVANETRKSVLHHLLTAGGDDWTETTLGNVIQLSYGKALKAEDRDGDGFPVFGSAGEVGQHSEPNVPFVPVVIVGRKGTAGAVWWSDIPCSVIDTAYFLVLKAEGNPKYFYHLLESLDLPTLTAQTGVPGLNRDRVHSCEFLCPPLIEQQRIVDEVSKIDAVIQETTSALAATRQLRSALLNKEIS